MAHFMTRILRVCLVFVGSIICITADLDLQPASFNQSDPSNVNKDHAFPITNTNYSDADVKRTNSSNGKSIKHFVIPRSGKLDGASADGFTTSGSSTTSPGFVGNQNDSKSLLCPNWCRYIDKNLEDCWQESLRYRALELKDKVEGLYSVLLHIDHWKRLSLDEDDPEINNMTLERSILKEVLDSRGVDSPGKVNTTTIGRIFELVIQEFKEKKHLFAHADGAHAEIPFLPSLSCPVPCDHYPEVWVALTAVLSATLFMFILVVVVYLFCDAWSPKFKGSKRRIV